MRGCARCEWVPRGDDDLAPRLQLLEHAEAKGHPLCLVCSTSLALADRQTCESCLTKTRVLLAGISVMYDELPRHLGHVRSQVYDAGRPESADGRPLPGGDVLVLLGAGSEGLEEDGTTSRDGDAVSVAFTLEFWREEWEDARGERVVERRPRSSRTKVRQAVGYLERMTRWAAQQHAGFVDYADDLRLLHGRLERATGRNQPRVKAEAECFDCGADALVREVREGEACGHRPPEFPPASGGSLLERRALHEEQVSAWEAAHSRCEQGGHEDRWTCQRCGRTYDWPAYLLACRSRVEDGRRQLAMVGWGAVAQVAAAVGSAAPTVRKWAQRGLIRSCCLVQTQEQLVWYPDADMRARRARCQVQGHEPDPDPMAERTVCLRCEAVLRGERRAG